MATKSEREFEGGPLVGHVQLTPEDFTSIWSSLPQNRQVFIRFGLWFVLVPVYVLMHAWLGTNDPREPFSVPWPMVAGPVLVVGVLAFALKRGRDTWGKNAVADLRGAEGVEFRFDAKGFALNAPGRQVQHEWASLYRCIELPNAFAIYTAPAMVMVVPKRAFPAHEQARLRARLLEFVPNRPLRGTNSGRSVVRLVLLWVVLVVAFLVIWQLLNPG